MRPSPTSSPEESLLASLRLAGIHGIGPGLRRLLFERYGDAAGILAASADELRKVAGIGPRLAEAIAGSDPTAARELLSLCRARGVGILQESDDTFPAILRQIPDPPDLLFVRGSLEPADSLAVAVVGARHATAYGLRVAQRLGGSLARAGYTVVSGLARGIDSAAHQGALEAGGRTIAVLGSGVLEIYPPEHADLAKRIEAAGAVISESPPLATASAGAFPRRNRIVSGLSLGVVVVEASTRSGALITARLASEQGREVFAVPGSIESRMSRGCHRLLKDGACLVEGVDDILDELGPLFEATVSQDGCTVRSPAELRLGGVERRVLEAVGEASEGRSIDEVIESADLPAANVLATVSVLESRRLVRRLPGNRLTRR